MEVTKMFRLCSPAWLARLAYVVGGRSFRELESSRQIPAAADLSARLEDVLKQLPGEQRVVVELAYRFKWSREDIATMLNSSVESVSRLMVEGTAALKRVVLNASIVDSGKTQSERI
jgi:DNA-directed RNA polymerase specialized sigma24 family protein